MVAVEITSERIAPLSLAADVSSGLRVDFHASVVIDCLVAGEVIVSVSGIGATAKVGANVSAERTGPESTIMPAS